MIRIWKRSRSAVLLAAGVVGLLVLTAGGFLFTHSGLELALEIARAAVPELSVEASRGAVFPGFSLEGVRYRDASSDLDASVGQVSVTIDPSRILITGLLAAGFRADNANFSFGGKSGTRIQWTSFQTRVSYLEKRITVGKTAWNNVTVTPGEGDSTASSRLVLPGIRVPLSIVLDRLDINRFTLKGATGMVITHLGLSAAAYKDVVKIQTLDVSLPQGEGHLAGEIRLKGEYPLALSLTTLIREEPVPGLGGNFHISGSLCQLNLSGGLSGPVRATFTGRVNPLEPDIPFNIRFEGEGSLPATGLPGAAVTLIGSGTRNGIRLHELTLRTLGGSITGTAGADWKDTLNWQADLALQDIRPGLQWKAVPGHVEGTLKTTGALTAGGGWQLNLPRLDLRGVVRGYPLTMTGAVTASSAAGKTDFTVDTPGLTLAHGPNHVVARGTLADIWDMTVAVKVPSLEKSIPGLSGGLDGEVSLNGSAGAPDADLRLTASDLSWQNQASVRALTLEGRVTPIPEAHGQLTLRARDLSYQGQRVDQMTLTASGDRDGHDVTLDLLSDMVSARLAVHGALARDNVWQGRMVRADVTSKQGTWTLDQPAAVRMDPSVPNAVLSPHCWHQNGASLCLAREGTFGPAGQALVTINDFNLDQVRQFLPRDLRVEGRAGGRIQASWQPGAPPKVSGRITLPPGRATWTREPAVTLAWQGADLDAVLEGNRLQADVKADLQDNGTAQVRLALPDITQKDHPVDGRVLMDSIDPSFLAPLIGKDSRIGGNIQADLTLAGSLFFPAISGKITVHDIRAGGEAIPVNVEDGRIGLIFQGDRASFDGEVRTAEGTVNVSGNAGWESVEDWRVDAGITAEGLEVDIPSIASLNLTPDIFLSVTPGTTSLTGRVSIPRGRITVNELPRSAVGVSPDQILLDAAGRPLKEKKSIPPAVATDLKVDIGEDVRLSAFGLKGQLNGQLAVTQKDREPFVTGEVRILNGTYRSLGQDLIIQEGKVLLNGPPDKPYVAITAIRNPDKIQDNVTAGVTVTGPAERPDVRIFSDPAMPQANALSYLLRGRNLDSESGSNDMTMTLVGLSLARSGKIVGEIGQAFGVRDLALDTQGSGDDAKVAVSGYILPGLKVKYARGFFDSVGEITLQYRLMKNLYVNVVSGLYNAVDLLYRFEVR